MREQSRVTAVLGPTNTGKTHYAIERMLAHRTGVIGLPLRLLAREVYDRIVALRGPSVVALVTGEERIVPDRTQYWVCTVEAMPLEIGADFVAVDEIQLCGDAERGHVFTDRLLRARGLHETLFLGADTMRGAISALVKGANFQRRERFSELSYTGAKKISRLPPRSAIVGFSVENVYAIAELIRRQKGGCAVVMGALSPRTRNAQVALYQNGDVDYLVATDAIGMGLNLDIQHVAFSSTAKFDGRRMRALFPQELAQIAGRAGRHTSPGSFGVTGEARPMGEDVIEAIEANSFTPLRKLHWRNNALDFGSAARLIASLEMATEDPWLSRMRDADDLTALRTLYEMPEVSAALRGPAEVRLLWDVCRIPDFRGISPTEHAGLLARIFGFLCNGGRVPGVWIAGNIARIDRTDGDIDALSRRLAFIRTWTYVAQRRGWVEDENHWRNETRAVEDRLSDALHGRLTQRFVDRRTSVLMRRLKQRENLVAEVNDKGEVRVEGQFIGRLEGFRFRRDAAAGPDEARTLRQAAEAALAPQFILRSERFYNSPDTEMDLTEQGGLMWGDTAVGKLVAGPEPMKPQIQAFVDEEAGADVAEKVRRRLQHFIDRRIAAQFQPLVGLQRDETLTGLTRGFAFRMVEALGVVPRAAVANEVKELDQNARGALRRHGIRFGQHTVFMPALLKPAPTRLRLVLWSLHNGLDEFPQSPPPGLVTIAVPQGMPRAHLLLAGYHAAGARAIRIDMMERLADMLRACDARAGFEATPDMLSITGLTLEQFADLMQGLGFAATRGERQKQRPEPAAPEAAAGASEAPGAESPADAAPPVAGPAPSPDAPTEPAEELATAQAVAPAETEAAAEIQPADAPADPAEVQGQAAEAAREDAGSAVADAEEKPDAGDAAQIEAFFLFTRVPRARGRPAGPARQTEPRGEGESRPPRRDRRKTGRPHAEVATTPAASSPAAAAPAAAERARTDRPAFKQARDGAPGGKAEQKRGQKPGGRKFRPDSPRERDESPRSFSAGPERKDRIDPDNPFAKALMGLRDRK